MTFKGLVAIVLVMVPAALMAQYYDQGQSPASIKWNVLKKSSGNIVYSQQYERKAMQVSRLIDTLKPVIGHTFRYGPMRMPIVLKSQNLESNGLVLLAPKRMELITAPSISTYSEPWLKQLVSHEMRHSVQYSNLNRNFVKALGYIIGEQAPLVATALMPVWFMEGDATMAETQLSTFGRGLQPSFTIEYRQYADENTKFPLDKWFCGSYKDKIPDHYQLGYQIVSYAYDKYGENPWDKVINYTSKYPFFILTSKFALKKYYRTSENKLAKETFDNINTFWRSLPRVDNSATVLQTKTTSFTTYMAPQQVDDNSVVAVKNDFDNPFRVVLIDAATATEKVLGHIGRPSTPPVYSNGTLYWTEYRQSTLWEQRVNSVLCQMNLSTATKSTKRTERQALYPTPMPQDNLALVEYDYSGTYRIRHNWGSMTLPDTLSIHGLTYDQKTDRLYFIALSDHGMWIGSTSSALLGIEQLTAPAHITIDNLRAQNGRLYYTSIASGRDEAYLYDIATARQSRISTSTYGSFAPVPTKDGKSVYMTTYGKQGYMVSHQSLDSLCDVAMTALPENVVNPPRKGWDVALNLDSIDVQQPLESDPKPRRYRKALHLFDFHSWAPLYMDPQKIVNDLDFTNTHFGVTMMSQNLLSSLTTILGYGYTDKGSVWRAKVGYLGLPVKFDVEVIYGGGNRSTHALPDIKLPSVKKYFGVGALLSVPLNFSSGYHLKALTPSLHFTHDNAVTINSTASGYRVGRDLMMAGIGYVDNVAMAYRDFLPRLGYALKVSSLFSPASDNYGNMWSLYVRGFLPGVAPHHSLTLEVAAEHQVVKPGAHMYNYSPQVLRINELTSTIQASRYYAARASYQLPVCYPDTGIGSLIYFKRVRLNGILAAARYRDIWSGNKRWDEAFSYGGEMILDMSPVRMPATVNAELTISVFKPSDRRGVVVSGSIVIPL